ncbi:hypothetical protein SynPROSU1_01811 [Synechococcus sp. PROS-U-1]|nr:hypothetical protein SynPROSU1_01811 [Synechococcus sp. PROS-U-1]
MHPCSGCDWNWGSLSVISLHFRYRLFVFDGCVKPSTHAVRGCRLILGCYAFDRLRLGC